MPQSLLSIGMLVLMFVVFYFILIRPQQKRQKKLDEMRSQIQKNDRVVTIGGMHGIVDAVDEEKVVIKAGDGSRLTFDRSSVREVLNKD
ncbi:preprotein translocase subunit YajC [Aureibacillus halotolerans]|uniref:Preprotein translocase subunit YajC n=1 Tax=Aureibacillus halotolerans TaxID=1508390 RepID=A0A4R6U012_9BACI|nr:preprotein translocase subunit YajC [Aureibacillus halotolerans]TDQ37983.1 preprotein translocase subunit YajC [Aureibacillus halotolerans]